MRKLFLLSSLFSVLLAAAELPVREVVLYKNGLGLFARSGELRAGEAARLEFKAEEMNDVLKSLIVAGADGARITGVHYDSSEPLEHKLAGFPFHLGDQMALSALLDQLKGARVELKIGPDTAAGVILSGREIEGSETQPPQQQVTLLLDAGDLRTLDLRDVTGIRFTDATLQLQLKDYLANISAGRSKEKRSIFIDSDATGARKLTATYVVPVPVWKSSYRLVFSDKNEPTLEGWAIIDNTSGEDWKDVRLSVVSGRPVSFISNLYQPRYFQRETVELPEDRAARPELYAGAEGAGAGGGVAGGEFGKLETLAHLYAPPPIHPQSQSASAATNTLNSVPLATRNYNQLAMLEPGDATTSPTSTIAAANAGQLAELFEYSFGSHVTVPKGESAMLPFLQQPVKARRLLIYKEEDEEQGHPRNAVVLVNTTGKSLDGGPITVFDGGAYAGEALVETIKSGDKRLISYAVDLGTRITKDEDEGEGVVREVHLLRGVVSTKLTDAVKTKFTIRNVDQKPKTLIIEHPIREDYKLVGQQPREKTDSAYRFEISLRPDSTETFTVDEEESLERTTAVTSMTPDALMMYVQNKDLNAAARQKLELIAKQKNQVAQTASDIKSCDDQVNELTRDEERTRQNIFNLNAVPGQRDLVQTYSQQLAGFETKLIKLRDRSGELKEKKTALETELNAFIEKLEF